MSQHDAAHQTACTGLLYERTGGIRVPWDTPMHEARVWLRMCYAYRTYDADQQPMNMDLVRAWVHDGTALRIRESFVEKYRKGEYSR